MERGDDGALLSWFELDERLRTGAPLILSVGSFEQHGPHLPLATDAIVVEALARAVAARTGGIVLPTLPYGAPSRPRSGGGPRFAAPALRLGTLLDSVEQLAAGAVAAGARALVVLSWHWENAAVLWDALDAALCGTAARALLFDAPWDYLAPADVEALFPGEEPAWASDHAGRLETAVMRHVAPELVGEPPAPVPFAPRDGYDVLPTPEDAVPATGVVLDARAVTAAVGERCFAAMVDGIVRGIAAEEAAPGPWS
ncbi:creatininase family protein [Conexibacter arvalis]|uniref:Creatinine amidohydrolase n=1 Tax=Conexibacter arvalis TaxID=912552 RepID=A0A840IBI1_9ACTN|nr:creatininase family protein [Conexibacter arvalis]MBB4662012.1 creatinine amidohydrolase [Conexibacter arvalis]